MRRVRPTAGVDVAAILARVAAVRDHTRAKAPKAAARPWYRIVDATSDTAEVWLYDEISWWGVTANDFIDELRQITAPRIVLRVNCPGGDVFDGMAIYQALLSHPARVEVQVDALAASAASYIIQAGDVVQIAPNAMIMIHDAWGAAVGNCADMTAMAEVLDKISTAIAGIYADATDTDPDMWRERMLANSGAGTWYTGQEAIDAGLADELLDGCGGRKRRKASIDGMPGEDGDEDDGDGMPVEPEPTTSTTADAWTPPGWADDSPWASLTKGLL